MNWKCLFFHDWVYLKHTRFNFSKYSYNQRVCIRCKKIVDEIEEYRQKLNREAIIKANKEILAKEIFDEYSQKR